MAVSLQLNPNRLFPADPGVRAVASELYNEVHKLPILSPHGHTDPAWFAENSNFKNPHDLLISPDHYLLRMLYSQGITMADIGIPSKHENAQGEPVADARSAWRIFASQQHLFRGTPTGYWLNHIFCDVFELTQCLDESNADNYFDRISELLQRDDFRPRALVDRFNIEFLATTESPVDSLDYHQTIFQSDWDGRVVTTYRPDCVTDPEHLDFHTSLADFGEITNTDVSTWRGYLTAHRRRRADFKALGATATDHGHPSAQTANLSSKESESLFRRVTTGPVTPGDAELFRAQMLTEMARMSLDDGLVMQIHPGSYRNHNEWLFDRYGRDRGADIPTAMEYTHALKPLLDCFGNNAELTIVLFTLDETTYTRELAPLAGHYPCLRLGPAWWFHDSPEGMLRFREQTTETAGLYNTAGFNDDTRALLSIPARHDMARRVDCSYLARLVCEHRISETDAHELALDLSYNIAKQTYRI